MKKSLIILGTITILCIEQPTYPMLWNTMVAIGKTICMAKKIGHVIVQAPQWTKNQIQDWHYTAKNFSRHLVRNPIESGIGLLAFGVVHKSNKKLAYACALLIALRYKHHAIHQREVKRQKKIKYTYLYDGLKVKRITHQ